ncbi:MAG: UDP-glucose/GDP-mannose dehydrogenase family protein [Hyphomicrobiaceae bacterium]|nr:UDP-glucose/GDP-mannose dehydrogenase family protein [Hyphomicrobiaceae bacterium]
MKVVMIGTGYVGLVSGACFADFGHDVTCIDKDEQKIKSLKKGKVPFFEPGLDSLVASNIRWNRLSFDTDLSGPVSKADVVFIAVGTPSRESDGHADLSYVMTAAEEIANMMQDFTVIVNKSTVPVGTGDEVEELVKKTRPDCDFAVVSNPEFLREGSAIYDFKHPDRVMIGTNDERAREVMRELYRPLYLNETPILFADRRTSELTKYASNAFLANKISFINEMADLCEATGADIQQVARGIGLDGRIGNKFLHAGPGYGGSCFPKDTLALVKVAEKFGASVEIVDTVIRTNNKRKERMAQKVIHACGGDVQGKHLAVLGLTFKQNTDDMRDSPSLTIIPALQKAGARISAYDPEGMETAAKLFENITFEDDPYTTMEGADGLVIITEWDQFRALDLERIKATLNKPIIIDLRNIYKPEEMEKHGFKYVSIGRAPIGY